MLANIIRNRKKTAIGGVGGGIVIDNGDPFYSAVSLLLPMDGTNGSTTFTDSGPNALTVTAANATISTTQAKYGSASGSFTGTASNLVVPSSTLFNFGAGDFTIECWIYWLGGGGSPGTIFTTAFPTDSQGVFIGLLSSGAFNYLAGNGTWAFNSTTTSNALSANQWYHIAYVRSGSTFTVYINGVASGSTTSSPTLTNSNNQAVIGGRNVFGQYFRGFIDDLRISRFARYVSNFTPPTAALPTTASSTPADPYYGYTSLLLHMDGSSGSTNFVDSGPNALAVTAVGNSQVSTTQSKYGGASAYFDGAGDYLSISDANRFNFGSGDFTVEFWFRNSNLADESKCLIAINNNNTSVGYAGIRVYYWLDNTIETLISSTGSSWAVIANTAAANSVSKNTWNHYAVVRSGNTIKIFLNGTQYISDKTMTGSVYASSSHLVGGLIASSSATQTFNGYIDDLRVTKYARYTSAFAPPAQAHLEYANGNDRHFSNVSLLLHMDGANGSTTFTDNSSNARTITAVGNAQISTTQSQFGGASAYFDGTGDYLSFTGGMPSGSGTAFTIECWIRLDDLSAYRAITRTAGGLDIGIQPSGMVVCDQTGVGIIADSATGIITAGSWYHIAVTRDTSNAYKVYVNGTQVASATNSFSVTAATTIGYSAYSGSHYFKGYIDDFRVTNALRYTANFTPPTSAHPNA